MVEFGGSSCFLILWFGHGETGLCDLGKEKTDQKETDSI